MKKKVWGGVIEIKKSFGGGGAKALKENLTKK